MNMVIAIAFHRCLGDVVKLLCKKYVSEDLPGFEMMVRRDHILNDAFKRMARPSFLPEKKLIVSLT